jgi:hypothetical protein
VEERERERREIQVYAGQVAKEIATEGRGLQVLQWKQKRRQIPNFSVTKLHQGVFCDASFQAFTATTILNLSFTFRLLYPCGTYKYDGRPC